MLIQSHDVQFEQDALVCPRCGGTNLHHVKTTVFSRAEDAPSTMVIAINERSGSPVLWAGEQPSDHCSNPSSRRGAVVIAFRCEECGDYDVPHSIQLSIVQHKGQTLVSWWY